MSIKKRHCFRSRFYRSVLAFLVVCSLHGPSYAQTNGAAPSLGEFPVVSATNLDKARFELPKDFGGEINLAMVYFAREQQRDVDTWLPKAKQLEATHAGLRFYELPTTARENLVYRWWFNSALRSYTADTALDGRILTLYVSKGKFRKALNIQNEKQIVTVLVDRSGRVLWRANGAYDETKGQSLDKALRAIGR